MWVSVCVYVCVCMTVWFSNDFSETSFILNAEKFALHHHRQHDCQRYNHKAKTCSFRAHVYIFIIHIHMSAFFTLLCFLFICIMNVVIVVVFIYIYFLLLEPRCYAVPRTKCYRRQYHSTIIMNIYTYICICYTFNGSKWIYRNYIYLSIYRLLEQNNCTVSLLIKCLS